MKIRGQTVYAPQERIYRMITVDSDTGCWNWRGVLRGGYGRMVTGSRSDGSRKSESAHRYSYRSLVGQIPPEMEVCHHCDNRRCVNPLHLFVGTHKENTNDRDSKGRNRTLRGPENKNATLTWEQVDEIRKSFRPRVVTRKMLAKRFGVSEDVIKKIVSYRSYVPPPPEGEK